MSCVLVINEYHLLKSDVTYGKMGVLVVSLPSKVLSRIDVRMYLVHCSLSVVETMSRAIWRLTFSISWVRNKKGEKECTQLGLFSKTVP